MGIATFSTNTTSAFIFSKEEKDYLFAQIRLQAIKAVLLGLLLLFFASPILVPSSFFLSTLAATFFPILPIAGGLFIHSLWKLKSLREHQKNHTAFLREFGRYY